MLRILLILAVVLITPIFPQLLSFDQTIEVQDRISAVPAISVTPAISLDVPVIPAISPLRADTTFEVKKKVSVASAASVAQEAPLVVSGTPTISFTSVTPTPAPVVVDSPSILITSYSVPTVPFYSQFKDITSAKWKKVGCGIASVAMVIEYYEPDTVSVNTLLGEAINAGAYLNDAGWIHSGLIQVSRKYGLDGKTHDFSRLSTKAALNEIKEFLKSGPVIASIHYKFEPDNPIPHLVVINGIDGDDTYYNDPAADGGNKKIATTQFLEAWKQRFIVLRPIEG